jgi:hypothetical protein
MKNPFKKVSKVGLMLAIAFLTFCHESSGQMTIQVPTACEVVVAGTGGATGPVGTVGNGGIVVMPDPFDESGSAGNFVLNPAGNTITGWTLQGDLSVQTSNVPPAAPIQNVGPSINIVNIESYNKKISRPTLKTY